MNSELNPGDKLEVTVQKIVPGGLGLAFAAGLTVFVPLAVPGDRLLVRVEKIKGNVAFTEIERIVEPSAVRAIPPCKFFGTCGGCDFQQLPYERQLAEKVEMIKDSLRRIGKFEMSEIPMIGSPKPLAYRTRALWRADSGTGKMGYYKRDSHDVVDVDHCPVLDPALDDLLQEFRSQVAEVGVSAGRAVIEAAVGSDGITSVFSADLKRPADEIVVEARGERFRFDARAFFQANLSLVGELMRLATDGATGRHALDLYCGVGLFALPLARKFEKVTGVESNETSIGFAALNADRAGLRNLEFFAEPVGKFLFERDLDGVDFVLLDPPRAGTEKNVIRNVIKLEPEEISYVACDPSILARDLRRLVDGGYEIDSLVALDLFPQTHHVEAVARLTRRRQ